MTMNAGLLNRRVTIQQLQSGVDPIGQPIESWVDVTTVYASIKVPTGFSAIKADADVSITQRNIRCRYREGINAGMRAVHKSVTYQINAVLPDMMGRTYLDLVCEVVT